MLQHRGGRVAVLANQRHNTRGVEKEGTQEAVELGSLSTLAAVKLSPSAPLPEPKYLDGFFMSMCNIR
jgi:hypothetical protein